MSQKTASRKFLTKRISLPAVAFLLMFSACTSEHIQKFEFEKWSLAIDSKGQLVSLKDKTSGFDHLLRDRVSYLLSLMSDSNIVAPTQAVFTGANAIALSFPEGISAEVEVVKKNDHLKFELLSLSSEEGIDAVIWGPYFTDLNKSVGEVVGIAQGEEFTAGIQALNEKTLGGMPWVDNDFLPMMDIYAQSSFDNMQKEDGTPYTLYSVEAAKPVDNGSSLQAYTRNRSANRVIENLDHKKYLAPAYADGGLRGSKMALFACATDATLATIGEIEKAEGLPHPTIDGEWVKTSPVINSSYLIIDFSEADIDECIRYTKMSGFNYLYHGHPFASWGHFPLLADKFPNGYDGMKTCVDKAEAEGIRIGTHTLTNFINVDDEYVTPVPDKRLAKVGSSQISKSIGKDDKEIEIDAPDFFNQFRNNSLRSVVIDDEIIRYGSVSETRPWILTDCQRGAFGTIASAHAEGTVIGKLADHPYKVFLGDADLNNEIAQNIARFMNQTGVCMLDFDGVEGTSSTGMGKYGEALMVMQWYKNLDDSLKDHFLVGASRTQHFLWHVYSRMNWGEPWYAGFRESQTEYRLSNQKFYQRNLMPGMLGWFRMLPNTPVEDIEWMMTRSAGFDAGFAFVTSLNTLRENGKAEEILEIMNNWESARLAGRFSGETKEKMRDLNNEFSLRKTIDGALVLTQIHSHKFKHERKTRQPGEPLYSTFRFNNHNADQPMRMILTATDADVSDIKIELNNYKTITIPGTLKKNQSIKFEEDAYALVYDENWNEISRLPMDINSRLLSKGEQSVTFDCQFANSGENACVKVELICLGTSEKI